MTTKNSTPQFASLVQSFFCQQLIRDQNASAQTVASYRDAFRLLLRFFQDRLQKPSTALTLADLNATSMRSPRGITDLRPSDPSCGTLAGETQRLCP
jgi:site-specific recombinase XerD